MKRNDYISWDEYFMGISLLSAQRSKDSHTQVGACIVSQDNKILSVGYNGMPTGCSDDEMPWDRNGEFERISKTECLQPSSPSEPNITAGRFLTLSSPLRDTISSFVYSFLFAISHFLSYGSEEFFTYKLYYNTNSTIL